MSPRAPRSAVPLLAAVCAACGPSQGSPGSHDRALDPLRTLSPRASATVAPARRDARRDADLFPLVRGNRWVYRGTVSYVDDGVVGERKITWTMEVTEVIRRGSVTAALLLGHPDDLPFTDGTGSRGEWIVVRSLNGSHYLLEATEDRLTRVRTGLHPEQLRAAAPPFLPRSVVAGETPGADGEAEEWFVNGTGEVDASVPGVPAGERRRSYELMRQSMSGHTIATYVAGVGLTHYEYGHHGSLSEVELDLIEFVAGDK